MGKQSRRKRERPPGEARAHRYLARAGLPDRPDPGPYRRLASADPAWFRAVCDADDTVAALAERADNGDAAEFLVATRARYGLLYRDLDTALAEYASRPVMIAAAWLRWWFEHHPPATRLLDVGCGPGVLTCAYALALPEAEVIGMDAVPEAVACGEALAGRLGVRNVSFVVGDCRQPAADDGPPGRFDQLVAVTALGDAGLYPQHPPSDPAAFSTVADVDGPGVAFRSPGVASVVARLSDGGSLLAFDRTADASQAVRFGAALLHAGVELDFRQAGTELFIEEGQPTTFTRFAGRRSAAAPTTTGAELAGWIRSVPSPAYGQAWHDELRFHELQAAGARRVWGCEIDYSPHSPALERREIWSLGDEVHGWVTTTLGLRELVSGRSPGDLWREYANYAARFVTSGLSVRFFDA